MKLKEAFSKWMKLNGHKENTINQYCRALENFVKQLDFDNKNNIPENLFQCIHANQFKIYREEIESVPNFKSIDESNGNGAFKASLKKYEKFLTENESMSNFKHLLEYFVAHLDYCNSGYKETSIGYEKYIKELKESNSFKQSGQGHNGENIQKQIQRWEKYFGNTICINIQPNFGDYKSSKCYLNWKETDKNIKAVWNNNSITALLIVDNATNNAIEIQSKSLEELGLFDSKEPNQELELFFKNYRNLLNSGENTMSGKNENLEKYITQLEKSHNIILTGAPGTGKTTLAKQIAAAMGAKDEIGFVQFHPSYDYTDFVEGLRPKQNGKDIGFERRDGVFKAFCKKALENLLASRKTIEILKSEKTLNERINNFIDDSIDMNKEFSLVNGGNFTIVRNIENKFTINNPSNKEPELEISKKDIYEILEKQIELHDVKDVRLIHSAKARQQQDSYIFVICKKIIDSNISTEIEVQKKVEERKYIFIIDEINRGEMSKIFGELFFSIEPSYRGTKGIVKTQYQNLITEEDEYFKGFFVPENVFIIGTMNDIDRSVESMDFAMRRRFTWMEVTAKDSAENMDLPDESKKRLEKLNEVIEKIEGLNSSYHIGGSYFLNLQDGNYELLWKYHIYPLLHEYLRGNPDAEKWEKDLEAAYNLKTTENKVEQ